MQNKRKQKAGGRPRKPDKRDQHLAVMTTLMERTRIAGKARSYQLTISEYLREMGLEGKIGAPAKTLPKEVLEQKTQLNHLAANLNQLTRTHNREGGLDAFDRAKLFLLVEEISNLIKTMQDYLR